MSPSDALRALSGYACLATLVSVGSALPPAPSAPATPRPLSTAARPRAAVPISATIQSNTFSPNPITATLGVTVTWTILDGVPHTVMADDGSWGSGTLGQGATYSHVFTSPGTYTYHCAIHPFMKGTVVVTS